MPKSLEELDKQYGRFTGTTDAVREQFGYGDRLGAAVDSYQAGLYGVAEAVGFNGAADRRRANEASADLVRRRSGEDTRTPDSFRDIDSVGSGLRYVAGLGIDSAPYLAEAAVGGLVGRAAVGGARAATAGAALASYPSGVGDIMQNQREQAGRADLASAAALGVPYAALNAVGLEGAVARGSAFRNGVRVLDDMQGARGAAARVAATGVGVGAQEGASEMGQEFANQAGRMAVDPRETFFNPESNRRFQESFVGGAALGGVAGGAGGGWRRSEGYGRTPIGAPKTEPSADLLQDQPRPGANWTTELGASDPRLPGAAPRADERFVPEWGTEAGASYPREGMPFERQFDTGGLRLQTEADIPPAFDLTAPPADADARRAAYDPLAVEPQQRGTVPGQYDLYGPDGQPTYGADPSFSDTNPLRPHEAEWGTSAGAAAPHMEGVPFRREIDTGGLALRADINQPTLDMFGGAPRTAQDVAPAEAGFELEAPGNMADARQRELDLAPAGASAAAPTLPSGAQRGITGQLGFSANTASPKGQVLQGFVESLTKEGHMDESTQTQASTLIAQGKFAAAKKLIDIAVKEKSAADAMLKAAQRAQEQEQKNAAPTTPALPTVPANDAGNGPDQPRQNQRAGDGAAPAVAAPARAVEPVEPGGPTVTPSGEQLPALSDADVIERVESAVSDADYDAAVQELYRRWSDAATEHPEIDNYLDENIGNTPSRRAFTKAWTAAEAKVEAAAREGKRGLKLGRSTDGTRSNVDKTTDDILRGLALPKANSESAVVDAGEGTIQANDTVRNPDTVQNEPPIPKGVTFRDGVAAAKWLAANANAPGVRLLMQRLMPHLKNVQVKVVELGDSVPRAVAEQLNGTARAVTWFNSKTQGVEIWARADKGNTQVVWAHELLHAATMIRLLDKGARAPFEAMALKVAQRLGPLAYHPQLSKEKQDALKFFVGQFRDADEFVAYSLTAPSFQSFLKHLDSNGNWITPDKQLNEVPKLSVWQKFVDLIRGLFKLPKVYEQDVQRVVALNESIAAENAAKPESLEAGILRLLDGLLAAPAPVWNTSIGRSAGNEGGAAALATNEAAPVVKANSAATKLTEAFDKSAVGQSTLGQKVRAALFNLSESPWALKWTTNDQIAEGYGHLKGLQAINRATGRMARTANQYLEVAVQTAKKWRALPDHVALQMQKLMLETTMEQMHVSIKGDEGGHLGADAAWEHASNKHIEKTPENRATFDRLFAQFHALPAAAKNVYDTVRDDLTAQHNDTLSALRKSAAMQYAGQLKRVLSAEELNQLAASSGDVKTAFADIVSVAGTRAELRALDNLRSALKDINSDFGTVAGPYFPLVRFGDHVVVMKSKGIVELEASRDLARTQLQDAMEEAAGAADDVAEAANARVDEARAAFQEASAALETAKLDGKQYAVEFHEKPWDAEQSRQAMARANPEADVYRSVREDYYRGLDGASPSFLREMNDTLAAALDSGDGVSAEAKAKAIQAMKDMYLRRQPERSALRAELRRAGIEGVKAGEMLRGYAQSARNGAWRISRLQHGSDVTAGLAELAADKRDPNARYVLNEMKARFLGDFVAPQDNKLLQNLSGATYFMHLGFNASYYLTNATQAWLISLPVMSGRHGAVNAANSLMAASKDVVSVLKDATVQSIKENGATVGLQLRLTDEQIAAMGKTPGEIAMLKALTDDGVIDITIKHDLGAISDGTGGFPTKVMELSSALANYPEMYNRLATALAAYRMEAARSDGEPATAVQARATQYAEHIINRTHLNYSPENAPRVMRGNLGRLVFQFKRYQQGMLYLYASLIKKAYNGDGEATKSLAYLLGTTMAVGGVTALPIAAPFALAAALVSAMYPDDDEPEFMQEMYNGMKDAIGETAARVLVKGAPTVGGLDLSKKVGQGDLLNPVGFAQTDGMKVLSRDWFKEVAFSLGGAGVSLLGREFEAAGQAQAGDYGRAAQTALPTFMANALKAYRQADGGITSRRGDTLVDPSEFGFVAGATRALGFENVAVSDMYDQRGAYMDMVQNRRDARKALLNDYYQAMKAGDSAAAADVRARIADYNSRQKADDISGKELAASLKQRVKQAGEMKGGLRVTKRDTDTYRELTE